MADILKFHMVRHGPVFNPDQLWYGRNVDFDLTSDAVVKRFNELAKILPTDPETCVWLSSDYPRALGLAEATSKVVSGSNIPLIMIDSHFIEQQYGIMENMNGLVAREDPRLAGYFADMWKVPPPDGESMEMLQHRIGGRLDELAENFSATPITDILVFGHGGGNMASFAHATGQRMIDVFQSRKGNIQHVTPSFSYASRLELHYGREQKKWLDVFEYDSGLPKHFPK